MDRGHTLKHINKFGTLIDIFKNIESNMKYGINFGSFYIIFPFILLSMVNII